MSDWDTLVKELPADVLKDKSLRERTAAILALQERSVEIPRSKKIVRTSEQSRKGVKSVPAKILNIVERVGKSPMRFNIMLYDDFEQAIIPTDEGKKISDRELSLVVHAKRPATADELAEYAKKGSGGSNARKNTYFKEGHRSLHAFNTYWISIFLDAGVSLLKENGYRFEVGDFVYVDGLHPTTDYGVKDGNPTVWRGWSFSTMTENPTMNNRALYKILKAPEQAELLNLGPSGEFSEDNWDAEGDAYVEELKKDKADPNNSLVKWNLKVLKMTPKARAIIKQQIPVSVPLQGTEITAEALISEKIIFQKPYWGGRDEWIREVYSKEANGKVKEKYACFSANAVQFLPNMPPQNIKVATVIPAEQANEAGITDDDMFVALAPVLFPSCDGRALCTVDVTNSSELKENDEMHNPIEHGKRKLGVDFAVQLNTNLLALDLVSGLKRVGFHITPQCAQFALDTSFIGKDKRREKAAHNLLNKDPTRPIINLLEYDGSTVDLQEEYQFILLTEIPATKDSIVEMVEDMKEKYGDGWMEHMSEVILGKAKQLGWDVKLPLSSAYTVFAIKNEVMEEHQPVVQKTSEEIAHEVKAIVKRQKPDSEELVQASTADDMEIDSPQPTEDVSKEASSPKRRKVTLASTPPVDEEDLWD